MNTNGIYRRNDIAGGRGGSTPFNRNFSREHAIAPSRFGGGGYKTHHRGASHHQSHHSQPHSTSSIFVRPPTNHNWEQEVVNVCLDYETMGMVIWVDEQYGEVVCEKNIHSSYAHFYFDGSTAIDGKPVAVAARSVQGLGLRPGSKIEFECRYMPPEQKKTAHMVHIKKMSVVRAEPKTELETLSLVSYTRDPHTPKLAVDQSGDYVLVSPVLFSKTWALTCIKATVIGSAPDYPEDKCDLTVGRTFMGTVMKAPRWILDKGEVGASGCNIRKILIDVGDFTQTITGVATVIHVVPFQNILLEADDRPHEYMFYPIVAFSLASKKELMVKGTRVHFVACRELPGFSHPWRVTQIAFAEQSYRPSLPPASLSIYSVPQQKAKQEAKQDDLTAIFGQSSTQLAKDPLEELLDSARIEPTPSSSVLSSLMSASVELLTSTGENCKTVSRENVKNLIQMEPSADLRTTCAVLGCSLMSTREAVDLENVERSEAVHRKQREYSHATMTIAEKVAEEKRRRRAEEQETVEAEAERERLMKLFEQQANEAEAERKTTEPGKKAGKRTEERKSKCPLAPEIEGIRTISLLDDIDYIFTQILSQNELKKAADLARKGLEKQKKTADPIPVNPVRTKNGFWFRRRGQRCLPTVLVAELCFNRTEAEICQDYHLRSLESTIILRNPTKTLEESTRAPPPVEPVAQVPKRIEEPKEKKKPVEVSPEPKNVFFQDDIVANFVRSLKKT